MTEETRRALEEKAITEQEALERKKKRFKALLEEGCSNAVIANRLGISKDTVVNWAKEVGVIRRQGRPKDG